jgi:hypothetical protein
LAVLGAVRRGELDELLPRVYDDVRPELLPIARYSLEAHLIKLEREGRAACEQGAWALREGVAQNARAGASAADRADPNALADRGGASRAERDDAGRAGKE